MNTAATQVSSLSALDLVLQSGPIGKIVLIGLLGVSIFCWALIFAKWKLFKRVDQANREFLQIFWKSKDLESVSDRVSEDVKSPLSTVFLSGYEESKKLNAEEVNAFDQLGVHTLARALARSSNQEMAELERHLGWLATTASAAPFIGLFGTVWGIMSSFQSIGLSGNANLAAVAPGISEALIATAAGIGAAVPAAIAYNYFVGRLKRISVDIDSFQADFLNLFQRTVTSGNKSYGKRG